MPPGFDAVEWNPHFVGGQIEKRRQFAMVGVEARIRGARYRGARPRASRTQPLGFFDHWRFKSHAIAAGLMRTEAAMGIVVWGARNRRTREMPAATARTEVGMPGGRCNCAPQRFLTENSTRKVELDARRPRLETPKGGWA
jgi:hypothetical protein